jgi:quinol monooxygenase YgiN
MEHVTFFRFKVLPGKRQAVLNHFERWEREQKSKAAGFLRSILVSSNNDPNEFMGAVRWDSTANYMKNANRPEQDAWFRELRSNLASDPEWFDGTLERESKV